VAPDPFQTPLWIDMSAVVVASLGGALVAMRRGFDLSGVFGLGIVTGLGGGLLRDLLLNELPVALTSPWYIVAATAAAGTVGLLGQRTERAVALLIILDAAALGLYGVTGVNKALGSNLGAWPALFVGLTAAVGGGVLRDVMTANPPSIFQRGELYATAALCGLAAYVIGWEIGLADNLNAVLSASITFLVRLAAVKFDVHLPGPRGSNPHPEAAGPD
jgi:uncharacterized membrane protein YeiH